MEYKDSIKTDEIISFQKRYLKELNEGLQKEQVTPNTIEINSDFKVEEQSEQTYTPLNDT